MGLFSAIGDWVRDRVDDAKNWIEDRVDDAKNLIEDGVEAVKAFFNLGSRGSYSGSVQETVDIDKVLNDFRTSISPEAKELEDNCVASVLAKFDGFFESEGCDYPELVSALKKQKRSVASHLNGVIINHINKRASTNDEQFKKILEMQPGTAKTQALKEQSQKFLLEAEVLFKDKLQKEMAELNAELSVRFNEELKSQEDKLQKKEAAYQQLLDDAERGQIDLNGLEEDCILVTDAYSCMEYLFAQMENEK